MRRVLVKFKRQREESLRFCVRNWRQTARQMKQCEELQRRVEARRREQLYRWTISGWMRQTRASVRESRDKYTALSQTLEVVVAKQSREIRQIEVDKLKLQDEVETLESMQTSNEVRTHAIRHHTQ